MSLHDVEKMLECHDLEIVEFHGVGFIYKVFYRFMPRVLWRILENILHSISYLKPFSLFFIFVCKSKSGSKSLNNSY